MSGDLIAWQLGQGAKCPLLSQLLYILNSLFTRAPRVEAWKAGHSILSVIYDVSRKEKHGLQGSRIRLVRGLVNFVPALA